MCATRFSSMYKMLRSLQQNKQALINTVVLHGFDADERAKRIKSRVLSEAWWALNNCLVELMVPVAQLLTAIQADHANLADVHYGLAIVDKWFGDATRHVWIRLRSPALLGAEPRGSLLKMCADGNAYGLYVNLLSVPLAGKDAAISVPTLQQYLRLYCFSYATHASRPWGGSSAANKSARSRSSVAVNVGIVLFMQPWAFLDT
ncbi:hypothetical protein QJQ45_008468 [Haematococcus lacustris]|nr:hypothetical protein QJQ45_008468 [Haematococcus lacustris]